MATVSKNLFWQTVAAFLQIYTGGIVFIIMAKMMKINEFGLLSFGFSLGTLLATCLDFGQSLMIMKDYPQAKFDSSSYILNSMAQKVTLVILFGGTFLLYLNFFYEGDWITIGNKFILFAIISAYVLYLQAVLRVKNNFKNASISTVIYALAISVVVIIYSLGLLNIFQFVTYIIYGKILQLAFTIFMCKEIFKRKWFNRKIQKYLFKNSWSYGAHFIFGTFYFTIDTQIIALLLEAKDVALYQSIFRIIYIFLIVSDVASNVLLPYLSSKFAKKEQIDILSGNILYLLLIMGSLLFLIFTSFYKEIIAILYTAEYVQAYTLVFPLSIVILLRTTASIYGTLLTISNNQVNRVKIVLVSMLISVMFNFTMIPIIGIVAAAWVSVLVHIVLFGGYYLYAKKEFPKIGLFNKENWTIIAFTTLIFLLSNTIFNSNLIIKILFLALWCVGISIFLRRHRKDVVVKGILKDRGVL